MVLWHSFCRKNIFVAKDVAMLTVQQIRADRARVIEGLAKRGMDAKPLIDEILAADDQRKRLQQERDDIKAKINTTSKEIGQWYARGEKQRGNALKEEVSALKATLAGLETAHDEQVATLEGLLVRLPNVPHHSVPSGNSAADNQVVRQGGPEAEKNDKRPHWALGKDLGIIDFELGNLLTGSGFPVYRGKGARLQRALIQYFLDQAISRGYEEIIPPLLVNEASAFGTGQLPDKEGQMYTVPEDALYLIPTAEVPITNLFRNAILSVEDLPRKQVGYTPCFRREAGSYGKEVRGLNRVHQFDKVEIVQIAHPEHSYEVLDEMVAHVESLVQALGLPYRILRLCGGDMGFTAALTYDFEVYAAAQDKWLEVSSVSNFETFQSNRLQCRFKEGKQKQLVHTLNGSALALPRIMAALLENYQDSHGVVIPEVLRSYAGFDRI